MSTDFLINSKKIPRQDQTIQTKPNNTDETRRSKTTKKILPTIRGKMGETLLTTGFERGLKIWEQKIIQKSRMDGRYGNRVVNAWKRPSGEHTPRRTQGNFKERSNWKTPGLDDIHGFWFKKFTSIHDRLATEINKTEIPEWMITRKTTQIQKYPLKGTASNNYWPVTCLPMMWKILTAQIREI